MKRKRKPRYSLFGYILKYSLTIFSAGTFLLMLGFTGACEIGNSDLTTYLKQMAVCMPIFAGSVLLYNEIFED